MRTDLTHLPAAKQRDLERVVTILFEEFGDATALASGAWKKKGRILKIILYGSYARGNWVDEPHTAKGYQSDFDLLIIVSDPRLTDPVKVWEKAKERLTREFGITKTIKTPVNFIVHTLQEVNDGLAHGRYFFMDIARDGIALYEGEGAKSLPTLRPKTPEQALALASEYFEGGFRVRGPHEPRPISLDLVIVKSRRSIDLTDLSRIECREPFGPHQIEKPGGEQTVSDTGVSAARNRMKIRSRPLETICFAQDDPGSRIIEPQALVGGGRDLDGEAYVRRRRARDQQGRHDPVAVLGGGCEENGARTVLAALLATGPGFMTPEECVTDDKAGDRCRQRHQRS